MPLIYLGIITVVFILIRVVFFGVILRKYTGLAKGLAYYVLTVVTAIFVFFPACIFSGAQICWDYDVTDFDHRVVLLVASAIILPLCGWVWYKTIKDPRSEKSSSKSVGVLIAVLSVIAALIIIILGTSPYWAPLVGH